MTERLQVNILSDFSGSSLWGPAKFTVGRVAGPALVFQPDDLRAGAGIERCSSNGRCVVPGSPPRQETAPSIEVIVQTSFLLDKSDCQRLTGKVAAIVTKDWHDLWPGVDSG
jgi:hypothetical protein